jgi:hypothetical protein
METMKIEMVERSWVHQQLARRLLYRGWDTASDAGQKLTLMHVIAGKSGSISAGSTGASLRRSGVGQNKAGVRGVRSGGCRVRRWSRTEYRWFGGPAMRPHERRLSLVKSPKITEVRNYAEIREFGIGQRVSRV